MAKYKVSVTERNCGCMTVEAGSEEEAQELVEQAYENASMSDDIVWGKTDFQVGEIEEVP